MIEQILQADRLLQVDQVDKSRAIYQRVVEMDPRNAIAVVGLARCALADGDDAGAHRLAARALAIDPENDMARRMEARLSEILTTRGEAVDRPEAAVSPGTQEMRPVITEDAPPAMATEPAGTAGAALPAGAARTTGTAPTTDRPAPAGPPSSSPSTRPTMRKSLVDRLLGR